MERRSSPRQTINYPVWVICIDAKGDPDDQCLGYALDISESGMLIESPTVIRGQTIKILASATDKKVIEIAGGIVYTDHSVAGKVKVGIRFIGSERENSLFSEKFIEATRLWEAYREQVVNTIFS
jgi:PilZ domain